MIPFFLTMPISRMMPITAMMSRSWRNSRRRAELRRRRMERRQNRYRMDETLVQDAEHDVDSNQRGKNQDDQIRIRSSYNAAAVPWKSACTLAGMLSRCWTF